MIKFIQNQILYPFFVLLGWHKEDRFLKAPNKKLSIYQQYILKGDPYVVRGGAKKLKAYSTWTDSYLIKAFGNADLDVETSADGRYNPDSPTTKSDLIGMTIKEFIEEYKHNNQEDEQYYLAAPTMPNILKQDVDRPEFLSLINSMRSRKKDKVLDVQLFLGNNNNTSPLHTDSYHNFYHLLDGEKEVLLIPARYTKQMESYVKLNQCIIPDIENINYQKYPDMKGIPITKVLLKKGDLLYIPYGCWHQMKGSKTRNLAVALWY
tara:strand:+ start:101 stop:892 length:792 start_codon:yes stop_codon:yes gene_type:complete